MPSRKGKGRQSLGFATKSQRRQFHHEWQVRLQEDYYAPKRKDQQQQHRQLVKARNSNIRIHSSQERPKIQATSLRRLIAERQYWDRVEDRSWIYGQSQQAKRVAAADPTNSNAASLEHTSPPGWLLFHKTNETEADGFASEYLSASNGYKLPTLQSLALDSLAKALPNYLEELGVEQLHNYLSLLPGPALSLLSVLTSQSGQMTNQLCQVLGQHSHLTRFSLVACAKCEETDPNWKDLQPNKALRETFLEHHKTPESSTGKPLWVSTNVVPDSWEDLVDGMDQDDEQPQSPTYPPTSLLPTRRNIPLQRLELGNLPLLQVEVLRDVLVECGHSSLTHLGLSGSLLYYDRGPDVLWQLADWVPHLQVLDVSGNVSWVTEPVLRSVYESYQALRESKQHQRRSRNNIRVVEPEEEEVEEENENSFDDGTATTASITTRSTTSTNCGCTSSSQQHPTRQRHHHPLLIKATGCLSRSSQILMEMEFGTLF